jgi:meso-butanediol dehydrogenase/(S,S)-butanediol dehydrogenase/diacetyl reductase
MVADDGKPVVLITGASAGLGRAIALRFAQGGYNVVGVARGQAKLDALEAEIAPIGGIATLAASAADPEAPGRAVNLALERFGRIDCLVNNAGSGRWGKVHETDDAMLDEVIDLGLKAPFRFAREAVPHMRPGSSIIAIGSTWGVIGGMGGGIYCAVKSSLVGLTKSLATDYGPVGIRANLIAPSVIRTDMTDAIWESDYFQRINQEATPFDRDGTADDIAETAFFLAGKGGGFINGQTIALDGGWSTAKYVAPQSLFAERVVG